MNRGSYQALSTELKFYKPAISVWKYHIYLAKYLIVSFNIGEQYLISIT